VYTKLEEHARECENRIVECKAFFGCGTKLKLKNIEEHEEEC
jgi:hypothetical protein